MKNLPGFLFLLLCFSANQSVAQASPIEHGKLNALTGRWTIEGMEDRYLEICEMYQGEFFMVCNTEFKTKSGAINKSVSIIGYGAAPGTITYYHYGSKGESQTLKGTIDTNGNLYFEGEETVDGKLTRNRVYMTPVGDNYNFREETSVDGGPFSNSAEFVYVRLKS